MQQSTDNQAIKSKIQKLLTLAGDPGAFEGEIDNALRFARRLMLQHNMTEADVLGAPQDPHEAAAQAEYAQATAFTTGSKLATWEILLAHAVADLIGTVKHYQDSHDMRRTAAGTLVYNKQGQPEFAARMTFYGPAEDAREATSMFTEWSHVIASMARLKFGGCFRGDGKAYAEGFAQGLKVNVARIHTDERHAIAADPTSSGALVVVRAKDVMAAKREYAVGWLAREHGIKLSTGKSRGRTLSSGRGAYGEGFADGRKSGLSRSRTLRIGGAA